jgi:hypothetical protein
LPVCSALGSCHRQQLLLLLLLAVVVVVRLVLVLGLGLLLPLLLFVLLLLLLENQTFLLSLPHSKLSGSCATRCKGQQTQAAVLQLHL